MLARAIRYRPTRTADGEGGWTDTYADGVVVYGGITIHHTEIRFTFRNGEDIIPEDIIQVGGGYYRVMGHAANPRGLFASVPVERTERPIVP